MALQNNNITSKNYKKLALQVSLDGFSFCCFDVLNSTITHFEEIVFEKQLKMPKVEELYRDAFKKHLELQDQYDEIVVLHQNNLSTIVPTPLLDEDFLGSYLQYSTKVFETDFFTFDRFQNYQLNTVYIPYVNINNFLIDEIGSFDYKHSNSILVEKVLVASKNNDNIKMVVNVQANYFEIVVAQNQKLLLFNSFEYKTPEDFIYYILFTAEQLQLNPEVFQLELLGIIEENDAFYTIAYQYIRHITFFDVNNLEEKLEIATSQILKHYTLFQS